MYITYTNTMCTHVFHRIFHGKRQYKPPNTYQLMNRLNKMQESYLCYNMDEPCEYYSLKKPLANFHIPFHLYENPAETNIDTEGRLVIEEA